MKKEKIFECKPDCKERYVDMVVLSCEKCIKHIQYPLNKRQVEKITTILNEK